MLALLKQDGKLTAKTLALTIGLADRLKCIDEGKTGLRNRILEVSYGIYYRGNCLFNSNCIIISHNLWSAIGRIDHGRTIQSLSKEIKDYFGDTAHITDFFCGYYFANGGICIIMVFI